jgi:hypothetical protein
MNRGRVVANGRSVRSDQRTRTSSCARLSDLTMSDVDRNMSRFLGLAAVMVGLTTMACNEPPNPIAPSPPAGPGGGAPPAAVKVARLEIGGPDSVPPGEQVQLSATAVLTDGTTRVVTSQVEWGSINDTLSVTSAGLVTAGPERGEGHITAKYTQLPYIHPGVAWATREQYVLPEGTYRLYGTVKDEGVYLDGVRVEITAGSAAGMSATANGFFRFYGVEGDTEIRVSKEGYDTQVRRATVTSHHTEEFGLALSRPRPAVEGAYTLTVIAAAECRANLPAEARQRTYGALVAQDGPKLTVTLDRAKFPTEPLYGPGNRFSGSVGPGGVIFHLFGYYDEGTGVYPPTILEELDVPSYFTFYGKAVAAPAGDSYAGRLDGEIAVLRVLSVYDYQVSAFCQSADHEFLLTR